MPGARLLQQWSPRKNGRVRRGPGGPGRVCRAGGTCPVRIDGRFHAANDGAEQGRHHGVGGPRRAFVAS
eukprot:7871689-Lingulodinium_polyedra.AAC.1